jgi:hypothetical protein
VLSKSADVAPGALVSILHTDDPSKRAVFAEGGGGWRRLVLSEHVASSQVEVPFTAPPRMSKSRDESADKVGGVGTTMADNSQLDG